MNAPETISELYPFILTVVINRLVIVRALRVTCWVINGQSHGAFEMLLLLELELVFEASLVRKKTGEC